MFPITSGRSSSWTTSRCVRPLGSLPACTPCIFFCSATHSYMYTYELTYIFIVQSKLGASLLETFDIDQLEDHINSCRTEMEAFNLKAKGELVPEADMCTICKAKTALFFEPTPKECAACHSRIKKLQHYYQSTTPQAIWCAPCYQGAGETIRMGTSTIKKDTVSNAVKKKNAETQAEPWVACDGCNRWVHMLCGLFNKGSNKEDTNFLCPWCLQAQQRDGTWTPIKKRPQSMLSAEELPRTDLSDFMENYVRTSIPVSLQFQLSRVCVHAIVCSCVHSYVRSRVTGLARSVHKKAQCS